MNNPNKTPQNHPIRAAVLGLGIAAGSTMAGLSGAGAQENPNTTTTTEFQDAEPDHGDVLTPDGGNHAVPVEQSTTTTTEFQDAEPDHGDVLTPDGGNHAVPVEQSTTTTEEPASVDEANDESLANTGNNNLINGAIVGTAAAAIGLGAVAESKKRRNKNS